MNTGEAEHLAEAAIEALSHGRTELVDPAARTHAAVCAACAARVAEATALSHTARAALRRAATADADLDALVGAALAASAPAAPVPLASTGALTANDAAAAAAGDGPRVVAGASGAAVPSRRSLAIASALGLAALLPLAALSWKAAGGRGLGVFSFARDLIALGEGVLRLIQLAFPGGSTAASAAGLLLVCAIGCALKRLIDGAAAAGPKVQEAST